MIVPIKNVYLLKLQTPVCDLIHRSFSRYNGKEYVPGRFWTRLFKYNTRSSLTALFWSVWASNKAMLASTSTITTFIMLMYYPTKTISTTEKQLGSKPIYVGFCSFNWPNITWAYSLQYMFAIIVLFIHWSHTGIFPSIFIYLYCVVYSVVCLIKYHFVILAQMIRYW